MLATLMLQPYSKKALSPDKILKFPWEENSRPKTAPRPMTKAEHAARVAELLANNG